MKVGTHEVEEETPEATKRKPTEKKHFYGFWDQFGSIEGELDA